jgi:hypothetical protein
MIVRHTKHRHQESTFDFPSDSPSHSPGNPSTESSSDQTSELSGESSCDLVIEVKTRLPAEVLIE